MGRVRLRRCAALPEAERAEEASKLLGEIDSLIPKDPALAEVIAGQMEEAFKGQIKKEAARRQAPSSLQG